MGLFRCWCGSRNGECAHTNKHIAALERDETAHQNKKAHDEARLLRSSRTSSKTARRMK